MAKSLQTAGLMVIVGAAVISLSAQGPYVVGPSVEVSLAQSSLQHYETQIGADPERADHLIACAYVLRADKSTDNVFYVSFDHGKTWSHTLTVPGGLDPSCQIGSNETAFAASIHDRVLPNGTSDSFLAVQRSTDGGRTWKPSSLQIDTQGADRTYLTVAEGRKAARGRIYVHGYVAARKDAAGAALPAAFVLYTSSDDGATFDLAALHPGTAFVWSHFFPGNGVILNDGSLIAIAAELDNNKNNMFRGRSDAASAPDSTNGALVAMRSRDGGLTIQPASTIAELYYDRRVPQLSVPTLALDQSSGPFRGRLYAAWPDTHADRRAQIFLAFSDDGGGSWSAPRIVSDDAHSLKPDDRPNEFMPMLAVNKKGLVGISWYDRRDNPDNIGYFARFAASLDGGGTWLPSVRVSSHANLMEPGDIRFNGGDTAGLVADADGVFHPLWIDNRTGIHQMWTATVVVRGIVRH
jgi:hypothetical protein